MNAIPIDRFNEYLKDLRITWSGQQVTSRLVDDLEEAGQAEWTVSRNSPTDAYAHVTRLEVSVHRSLVSDQADEPHEFQNAIEGLCKDILSEDGLGEVIPCVIVMPVAFHPLQVRPIGKNEALHGIVRLAVLPFLPISKMGFRADMFQERTGSGKLQTFDITCIATTCPIHFYHGIREVIVGYGHDLYDAKQLARARFIKAGLNAFIAAHTDEENERSPELDACVWPMGLDFAEHIMSVVEGPNWRSAMMPFVTFYDLADAETCVEGAFRVLQYAADHLELPKRQRKCRGIMRLLRNGDFPLDTLIDIGRAASEELEKHNYTTMDPTLKPLFLYEDTVSHCARIAIRIALRRLVRTKGITDIPPMEAR